MNEVIKFCIAGCVVIGVDFLVYYLLINFLPFSISKGISFVFSGIASFFINKYWTFQKGEKSLLDIFPFIVANTAALGLNVLTNAIMLKMFPGAVLPALIIATGVTSVFAFFAFKFWVFK